MGNLTPENPWSKHHIGWDIKTKILSYYINGYLAAGLQFNGPIGRDHPSLSLGGNPIDHNYGNIQLTSFRIYDENLPSDQISNNTITVSYTHLTLPTNREV